MGTERYQAVKPVYNRYAFSAYFHWRSVVAARHHPGRLTYYLRIGEVWKYGTTTKGRLGRYSIKYLAEAKVSYIVQLEGTISASGFQRQQRCWTSSGWMLLTMPQQRRKRLAFRQKCPDTFSRAGAARLRNLSFLQFNSTASIWRINARRSVSSNCMISNTLSLKPASANTFCSGNCSEP